MGEIIEQALYNMGIYELRNYAREVGVNSPTTLKRNDLIDAIIAIKNGEVEPVKGLTRGRKPKNKEKVNLTQFLPPEQVPYSFSNNYPSFQVASPSSFENNNFFGDGTGMLISGNLQSDNNGCYYLQNKTEKVEIESSVLKNTNFKVGDYVQVNCKRINNKLTVTDIFEAKNWLIPFNQLEVVDRHRNLSFEPAELPLRTFKEKHRLMAGQSILVTYAKEINPELVVNQFAKAIANNSDNKFAIVSTPLKTAHIKKSFDQIHEISNLTDAFGRVNQVEQAINHIKRNIELNNNCIVFIGNLSAIYNAYFQVNLSKTSSESLAKNCALEKIAEIMSLSRQTKKCALTIFAFASKENTKTDYCENISAEINYCEKNGEYKLKDSFSVYKALY